MIKTRQMAKPAAKATAAPPGRSPAYPFIPVDRAIRRADQLWRVVGRADVDVAGARQHWGYGPSSSGGIQTEAALKQFGLLEVSGRGDKRRLKLSELAVRLVAEPGPGPSERRKLTEQAVLSPRIHRELHDRWGETLPVAEVRRFLTRDREFNENGADDLIAEYQKTMMHLGLVDSIHAGERESVRALETRRPSNSARAMPHQIAPATKVNEIRVLVDGDRLSVSALVDRQGLKKLMKILEANSASFGDSDET